MSTVAEFEILQRIEDQNRIFARMFGNISDKQLDELKKYIGVEFEQSN